ncbi:hypothetical protein [Nostoc sp. NMS9]|nr:hypothetical protein [Nostoc sp. NMS9]
MIHYPGFFSLRLQIFISERSLLSFLTGNIPDLKQWPQLATQKKA